MALEAIPAQPKRARQPVQLFDGSRSFVHAPQYHWHVVAAEGVQAVDQEARDKIVSIADLLDRFGHQIELQEEELCTRFVGVVEGC